MKIIKYAFLAIICLTITNCKTEEHEFPLDKRYWEVQDYDKVNLELRFGHNDDEKLPTFDNPEKRIIVEKLTDHQNYNVVLDDKELGLKHRNDVATKFFEQYKDMSQIYTARDRKDNYLYDIEMLAVEHFGLGLQLKYFKLDKIKIRDYANLTFSKTFNFYQLKDPKTYFDLTTLGKELTQADERKAWDDIRINQEKILLEKKIKHRSFGEYSKHNCGHEDCPYNGIMIKQGTRLTENHMWFESDKNEFAAKEKSKRIKKERRNKHKIIQEDLENE